MRISKRQLRRVIRESILLTESHEECVQALNDWSGDWQYSESECLDWWMTEGGHLIDFLPGIDARELSRPAAGLLEMLLNEFGMGGGDDYGYAF